jgi:DNA repair protein RadA
LYIDTENTFRPERIKQVAERYNLDPEQVLLNIMVGRAFTVDALINLLM